MYDNFETMTNIESLSHDSKISIIIAVYNGEKTIERCIESIIGQNYQYIELIVIDGGSSDNTVSILNDFSGTIDYWESGPDDGIYNAWNKGLQHATGDWICFLGADDYLWENDVISRMALELNQASQIGIRVVYGMIAVLDSKNEVLKLLGRPWPKVRNLFLHEMSIPHPGLMHHRTLFSAHGLFDESFKIAGDYEFLLRELKTSDALFVPDIILVGMSVGGTSMDDNSLDILIYETDKAKKMHGIKTFSLRWGWLIRAILKKYIMKYLGRTALLKLKSIYKRLMIGHCCYVKSCKD